MKGRKKNHVDLGDEPSGRQMSPTEDERQTAETPPIITDITAKRKAAAAKAARTRTWNRVKLMPDDPIGRQMSAAEYEREMEELRPLMAAAISKWKANNDKKSKARKKVSK